MKLRGICALVACLLFGLAGPVRGANVIEPDDYTTGTDLSDMLADTGVTLEVLDSMNQPYTLFHVTAVGADTTYTRIDGFLGERLFAHAGVGFFNDTRRFSASFAFDVSIATINVASGWSNSVIRMDAFGPDGVLIDSDQTDPLGLGYCDTLTVDGAGIRQVIVHTPADQGNFARLDHFTYVPEPASATLLAIAGSAALLRRRRRA